jgi:chromosome segregation ATPase
LLLYIFLTSLVCFTVANFPDFEEALRKLPAFELDGFGKTYALKTSILRRVTVERLQEKEEAIQKMSSASKKLKREFDLAQAASIDLEKNVADLAEALKKCQDEKKIAEDEKKVAENALESSKKDLEKLQKTHEEDLKLIENLRKDCDKSSKAAEDLHVNNADLAKTLSSKEQRIQDLEKALAE